jgi:hypothetical protein
MTPATRAALKSANRWQKSGFHRGDFTRVAAATGDRLAVSVGVELLRLVPG